MRTLEELERERAYFDDLASRAWRHWNDMRAPVGCQEEAYRVFTEYLAKRDALAWAAGAGEERLRHTLFAEDFLRQEREKAVQ